MQRITFEMIRIFQREMARAKKPVVQREAWLAYDVRIQEEMGLLKSQEVIPCFVIEYIKKAIKDDDWTTLEEDRNFTASSVVGLASPSRSSCVAYFSGCKLS